jgi:hypothetical protein
MQTVVYMKDLLPIFADQSVNLSHMTRIYDFIGIGESDCQLL